MSQKKTIAILCGGQSAEHEISILSARNVLAALDTKKFIPMMIYLSQQGRWYWVDHEKDYFNTQQDKPLTLLLGHPKQPFALEKDPSQRIRIDCVIPMLHGTSGEDGTVQGLLDVLNVPYVGSGVLGSAVCMQKHIAKRLLRFAGLPTPDWVCIDKEKASEFSYDLLAKQLGNVFFVKPSALGSSVGISKVKSKLAYELALQNAFQYGNQVIVERYVQGREIECSVLGNEDPVASLPGELITQHEFYSYEAKYGDVSSLEIITPADLPKAMVKIIQDLAVEAFKTLQCRGMARVDFFVTKEQEVLINEVNTIPGFTHLSMYPKNWAVSGLPFSDLLEDLMQLAVVDHHRQTALSHHYVAPPKTSDDANELGKPLE